MLAEISTVKEVEISQIDMRFETCRLKDQRQEKFILSSVLENGIKEPLQCVEKPGQEGLILLDGFKRLRSAVKLNISAVPVVSLGTDEAMGILRLLRLSTERSITILEQAALVDELKKSHGFSVMEIARRLERSGAWVSVRLGLIAHMSPIVKEAVFAGRFPVRSYMYTMRHFTRVNSTNKIQIDDFVKAVSGKGLSTRAIDLLAHGFFKGNSQLKEQILGGNIEWTLNQLKPRQQSNNLSEIETKTLKDLEFASRCISRIPYELKDGRLKSVSFFSEADILAEGIMKKVKYFVKAVEEFHDKQRQKEDNTHIVCGGEKEKGDSPAIKSKSENSKKNT